MFITFYGINNIGKSTHAKRLVRRLKKLGRKAVYLKYPIYDLRPSGPFLNKILRTSGEQKIPEEELQLWFILNRYQYQPTLQSYLRRDYIVVAEDYVGTGIAWGTAKGAAKKELEAMNAYLVKPDCALLLSGKRARSAQEKSHIHESRDDLIAKCARVLNKLAIKNKWIHVQVAQDPDVTAARIWKIVSSKI